MRRSASLTFIFIIVLFLFGSCGGNGGGDPEAPAEGDSTAGTITALACQALLEAVSGVIFCDDFDDGQSLESKYFEAENADGRMAVDPGEGIDGSSALRASWGPGDLYAGDVKRSFGRSPYISQSHSDQDFRDIYWRVFVRHQAGWTGNPAKFSRATILARRDWSQGMIAHLWGDQATSRLMLDPASGVSGDMLVTSGYNDWANLRWFGATTGQTDLFSEGMSGQWVCVEAHVRLNTPGQSDGVNEFWVNGNLEAGRYDLDWVGSWTEYGINAIFLENYWDGGAPGNRTRYFDNFVIATSRIGCG